MKSTYSIEVAGQKFNIKSVETKEHVDQVIHFVNDQIKQVSKGKRGNSFNDMTILALLNVADELFKTRTGLKRYKENIEERVKNILRVIDV